MAAIIANPDEDTPRLALADWLQEHGDKHDQARAEFIRLQIEAAKQQPCSPRHLKFDKRAGKIEDKHRAEWFRPLSSIDPRFDPSEYPPFARGLLARVGYGLHDLLREKWQQAVADGLGRVGVEELIVFGSTKRSAALIAELVACPALRAVASLSLDDVNDSALEIIGRAETCAHLSTLQLSDTTITDAGLKRFAATTGMARLRMLYVSPPGGLTKTGKTTADGVRALLHSARLPQLNALHVNGAGKKFGLATLLADPALAKLRALHLSHPVALADVLPCPHLTNLHTLELLRATVTSADVNELLASPNFANLKVLWLGLKRHLAPTTKKKLKERFGTGLRIDTGI
jgi:uncharacterized protein (TIGR02996 family)